MVIMKWESDNADLVTSRLESPSILEPDLHWLGINMSSVAGSSFQEIGKPAALLLRSCKVKHHYNLSDVRASSQ